MINYSQINNKIDIIALNRNRYLKINYKVNLKQIF